MAEAHINLLVDHSVPKHVTHAEIADTTTPDPALQLCMIAVEHGNLDELLAKAEKQQEIELTSFLNVSDEFTVSQDHKLLMRDYRLVIPQTLHNQIMDIVHEGHWAALK